MRLKTSFPNPWRWTGEITGRQYLLAGVVLFAIKFTLDKLLAGFVFGRPWTPIDYVAPAVNIGQITSNNPDRIFYASMMLVALPFTVRTVQPLIVEIDRSIEEASATLGAGRRQTVARVILPLLAPAMLTGFALAFARAVSEYGSVIFIAGNRPLVSEIVPLLIVTRLEQFDYPGAALLGAAMLLLSFVLLAVVNRLRRAGVAHAV